MIAITEFQNSVIEKTEKHVLTFKHGQQPVLHQGVALDLVSVDPPAIKETNWKLI